MTKINLNIALIFILIGVLLVSSNSAPVDIISSNKTCLRPTSIFKPIVRCNENGELVLGEDPEEEAAMLLRTLLEEMPEDITITKGVNQIMQHPNWSDIQAYLDSFENITNLVRTDYYYILSLLIETRADLRELDRRAARILKDEEVSTLFEEIQYQLPYRRLLQYAILASENVHNTVKSFIKKEEGRRSLTRKRSGQAIAIFLASRRTREAARAFLSAMDPRDVEGLKEDKRLSLLTAYDGIGDDADRLSAFWYYLLPVYERLRAEGYTFNQAGERLVYLCEHFREISREVNLFLYEYLWEDWLYERQSNLDAYIEQEALDGIVDKIKTSSTEKTFIGMLRREFASYIDRGIPIQILDIGVSYDAIFTFRVDKILKENNIKAKIDGIAPYYIDKEVIKHGEECGIILRKISIENLHLKENEIGKYHIITINSPDYLDISIFKFLDYLLAPDGIIILRLSRGYDNEDAKGDIKIVLEHGGLWTVQNLKVDIEGLPTGRDPVLPPLLIRRFSSVNRHLSEEKGTQKTLRESL